MIDTLESETVELPKGSLEFFRTGTGSPLVYLHGAAEARLSQPILRLSEQHTVYVPLVPGIEDVEDADTVRKVVEQIAGFVRYVTDGTARADIVGRAFGAGVALRVALEAPELIGQLVLEAPQGVEDDVVERLPEIAAWTLVLLGTRDRVVPTSIGRTLKHGLQHTYLMYVYDAGNDIETDQPERYDRVVREFLKRGEAFIINFGDNAD